MHLTVTLEKAKCLIRQREAVREQQGILRAPVKEESLEAVRKSAT